VSSLAATPCQALTAYVTYSGTLYAGFYDNLGLFGSPGAILAGQHYTSTYAFDVSPNLNTFQQHSTTVNYIYGGNLYVPLHPDSPLLSASVTIGGVTVAMGGQDKGEISGENNGGLTGFTKVLHIAQEASGGVTQYLSQYISNFRGASSGLLAAIDVAFAYHVLSGDTASGDFSVCAGNACTAGRLLPTDFSLSLTSPVALPASLPLFVTGIGIVGLLGLRRRKAA
jgi:hypothetical protein